MAWTLARVAAVLPTAASDNSSAFLTSSYSHSTTLSFSKTYTSSSNQLWILLPLHKKLHSKTPLICKSSEYKFPDPIPEFAESETEKFKAHLQKKLSKKDIFEDKLDEIVNICTEILNNFLHTEYGGPGTLLVLPFIDMADTLNERGLPGGPQAARASVKWAQNNVDKDWKEWTSRNNK